MLFRVRVARARARHTYPLHLLPDKGIDLIDEAAAKIRTEIDSKPEVMDRLGRRLIQLKIEREALKKEKDKASKKRLATLNDDIDRLEREYADLEEVWKAEKATLQGTAQIQTLKPVQDSRQMRLFVNVYGQTDPDRVRETKQDHLLVAAMHRNLDVAGHDACLHTLTRQEFS